MSFSFRAMAMHELAARVMYTQGVEKGVVMEVGESMVHITAIYKRHAILHKTLAIDR
jgi:hypothetical protein